MQEITENKTHSVSIQNRETVEMTGIRDVSSFNEEEINASGDCGSIVIKGSHLLVETLDLDNGILRVNGRISALIYSEKSNKGSFFGRMFS